MRKNLILGILIAGIVLFKFVFALDTVSPNQAKQLVDEKKAVIVDVREADEVKAGKVKGAIVLPMSLMNNNKAEWEKEADKLPKDKTIIVYCKSGRRAGLVGDELTKKGFKVQNMGGFDSWKSAGFPVE